MLMAEAGCLMRGVNMLVVNYRLRRLEHLRGAGEGRQP